MHEHEDVLAALVGQPNSGKSTIFNYLTGLHQTVANYPGVTVTKKSGHYHDDKFRVEVVDLPGTYSLTSYSQEERVTRDFLLLERPEVVVIVVDASNFRRHLYFVFQLLELQIPLVVCLNMMDIAKRRGLVIDVPLLEQKLGIPIIPTNGRSGDGIEELRKQIKIISSKHAHEKSADWKVDYADLEPLITEIDAILSQKEPLVQDFPTRWLAIKLLENDREARRIIQHHVHGPDWSELLDVCIKKIDEYSKTVTDSPRKTIASKRNELAETLEKQTIQRTSTPRRNSDSLDRILCHPLLGLACVVTIMFLMFELAFNLSDGWAWFPWINEECSFEWNTPYGVVDSFFSIWIPMALDYLFAIPEGDLHSLLYDGILAGVGGVVTFVPTIFFIFFFTSLLEQSGYIARVVVILDRIMRFFGLHGQSILPMILAGGIVGGCAIPAVMATRSMREQRERLLTIMIVPLMNCGAKVPVYALLISAFFLAYKGLMLAAVILISWGIALLAALVLSKIFIKGESSPLVIELPTYQVPGMREVLLTATLQSWWFIKKAGTIILAVSVFLWFLMYYPRPEDDAVAGSMSYSYAAKMGQAFEPVSLYAGFNWRDNVALIGGFAAKEVIVSTMATMYGIEDEETGSETNNGTEPLAVDDITNNEIETDDLDSQGKRLAVRLRTEENWSPLKAFVLILFVMIYNPCVATCIVIWRETGHIKYMLIAILYTNTIAAFLAVTVYQIGRLIGG